MSSTKQSISFIFCGILLALMIFMDHKVAGSPFNRKESLTLKIIPHAENRWEKREVPKYTADSVPKVPAYLKSEISNRA